MLSDLSSTIWYDIGLYPVRTIPSVLAEMATAVSFSWMHLRTAALGLGRQRQASRDNIDRGVLLPRLDA
jgi:hypothetical protein